VVIKLKAWGKKLKIVCDVAAINFYFGNIVLLAENEEQRKLFQKLNKEALIDCNDRLSIPLDEVEIMQYTGIKDDYGVKIYENDIVLYIPLLVSNLEQFKGVVKFSKGSLWINNEKDAIPLFTVFDSLKVLGNMFENPELLGDENNGFRKASSKYIK
jgi:uncharacterized phage protein (TIGR01671 family)